MVDGAVVVLVVNEGRREARPTETRAALGLRDKVGAVVAMMPSWRSPLCGPGCGFVLLAVVEEGVAEPGEAEEGAS